MKQNIIIQNAKGENVVKHITRMIIALLLLAMVLPMAVSCANTDQPSETTLPPETAAPSGSDISDTVAEDTLFALSEIPDDLRFDGQTIKILYWDDVPNVEFFVEDQTGEAVNDAIYRRNLNVQSQFGVNLEYTGTVGNYNNQSSFVNACINSTQSGADAYDIFCGYTMTGATLMTQGIAQDLTNYDIMEFDKPKRNDVHPTMKPVEMLIYLLKNSSERGNTVIDTFGGSGSTLIACEQTGRMCRTMELDPKYADVIRRRWAEFKYGEGCDWQALTPAAAKNNNTAELPAEPQSGDQD